MKKVLILNGPPRCGKDTAAAAVVAAYAPYCVHLKLSQPLKDLVTLVVGRPGAELEAVKDDQRIYGGTFRELQIGTYEALSRVFSPQWLGMIAAQRIAEADEGYFVLSDGGRQDDIQPLIRARHQLLVVQILRDGCTFNGDIRSYISDPRVATRTVYNDKLEEFTTKVVDIATDFFGE